MGSGRKIRGGADFLSHTVETTPPVSVDGDLVEFDGASGTKIKDGGLTHAAAADAIAKKHTQDTDQYVDYGGTNQVSAADLHTTVDAQVDLEAKKHTQNTDQYIDYGGANQKSAAQIKAAHDHISNTSNPHSVTAAQVAAIATANGTLNALSEKTSVLDDDVLILEDSAASYAQKKIKKSNLVTAVVSAYNPYRLTSYYQPSLSDGMYGAWKAGWEPFWMNQQWGGAPIWMDNLVDGATGEAYSFQAATGYNEQDTQGLVGYDNTNQYLSQSFKVSKGITVSAIWLKLYKVANPTANLTIEIYDNNAGAPNAVIANGTATVQAGTLHTADNTGAWYRFVFVTPPSLTANTLYHIVIDSSAANSTTNYWYVKAKIAGNYPHGSVQKGSNAPAWSAYSNVTDLCFLVEPVTNMLAASGQFDSKLTFSEGSPLDQSEAMTQPLKNFFDYKEGTISIVGSGWTKDKTVLDLQCGYDHDRIVLRCNATTGYWQLDVYDKTSTKYTITGTTDVSDSTVRRTTIAYRAKGDGADFVKLYLQATAEGTPLTGLTLTFDPLMKELGNMTLGGGYALAPTWTNDYTCTALPTAASPAWTYDGTATEAAHAVVSGGKLFVQIVGATDVCGWHIHPTLANANGWSVVKKFSVQKASDITGEIEAEVATVDDAKVVIESYHTYFMEVSYDHGSTFTAKIQLDMRKEHVLHAWGKGSDFFISCDGKLVVDGTGLMAHAEAGGASLSFGDYDATSGSNAESIWDYVKYYETASLPPQFTSGSLSEFAYFSGDQTSLLTALYNNGTLKSVKELCGVGRNYIDVGERTIYRTGISSSPTTTSTSATLLPDLECFAYGSEFEFDAHGGFYNGSTYATRLAVSIDGDLSEYAYAECADANLTYKMFTERSVKKNFCLHKVEAKWWTGGNTCTSYLALLRGLLVRCK